MKRFGAGLTEASYIIRFLVLRPPTVRMAQAVPRYEIRQKGVLESWLELADHFRRALIKR